MTFFYYEFPVGLSCFPFVKNFDRDKLVWLVISLYQKASSFFLLGWRTRIQGEFAFSQLLSLNFASSSSWGEA